MHLFTFMALALGLLSSALGEDRTFRVLYLDAPPGAPMEVQVFDGKSFQEIELPRMNFSEVYQLPSGPLQLRFFESVPADPENLPEGAPAVGIPAGLTDFYLLISPDPDNAELPIKAFTVAAGNERLKAGQTLWLNMTKKEIGGRLGSEKLALPPSGRKTTNAPTRKAEQFKVTVFYRLPGDELVYPLVNTAWRHDPRSRNVAFVMPQPGRRTPRIMVFRDFR